jgi:hypothetical protein
MGLLSSPGEETLMAQTHKFQSPFIHLSSAKTDY